MIKSKKKRYSEYFSKKTKFVIKYKHNIYQLVIELEVTTVFKCNHLLAQ